MKGTPDGEYGEDEDNDKKGASCGVLFSGWRKAVYASQRGRREIP